MATFLICAFLFVFIVLPDWIMNALDRRRMKKIDRVFIERTNSGGV